MKRFNHPNWFRFQIQVGDEMVPWHLLKERTFIKWTVHKANTDLSWFRSVIHTSQPQLSNASQPLLRSGTVKRNLLKHTMCYSKVTLYICMHTYIGLYKLCLYCSSFF
jgi:hypothetical protein